jgi:hypothetical protein
MDCIYKVEWFPNIGAKPIQRATFAAVNQVLRLTDAEKQQIWSLSKEEPLQLRSDVMVTRLN